MSLRARLGVLDKTGLLRRAPGWQSRTWRLKQAVADFVFLIPLAGFAAAYWIFLGPIEDYCQDAPFSCGLGSAVVTIAITASFAMLVWLGPLGRSVTARRAITWLPGDLESRAKECSDEIELAVRLMRDTQDFAPVIVGGTPGSGASSFLAACSSRLSDSGMVPIYVDCAGLGANALSVEHARSAFLGHAQSQMSTTMAERIWVRLLRQNRAVLVADSLEDMVISTEPGRSDPLSRLLILRTFATSAAKAGLPSIVACQVDALPESSQFLRIPLKGQTSSKSTDVKISDSFVDLAEACLMTGRYEVVLDDAGGVSAERLLSSLDEVAPRMGVDVGYRTNRLVARFTDSKVLARSGFAALQRSPNLLADFERFPRLPEMDSIVGMAAEKLDEEKMGLAVASTIAMAEDASSSPDEVLLALGSAALMDSAAVEVAGGSVDLPNLVVRAGDRVALAFLRGLGRVPSDYSVGLLADVMSGHENHTYPKRWAAASPMAEILATNCDAASTWISTWFGRLSRFAKQEESSGDSRVNYEIAEQALWVGPLAALLSNCTDRVKSLVYEPWNDVKCATEMGLAGALGAEASMAQGLRLAAYRLRAGENKPEDDVMEVLVATCLELATSGRFWYSRLVAVQAICLLRPDSETILGQVQRSDKHPFVSAAARLCSMYAGEPDSVCWVDESEAIRTSRFVALEPAAAVLLGEVVLLLNHLGLQEDLAHRDLDAKRLELPRCFSNADARESMSRGTGCQNGGCCGFGLCSLRTENSALFQSHRGKLPGALSRYLTHVTARFGVPAWYQGSQHSFTAPWRDSVES